MLQQLKLQKLRKVLKLLNLQTHQEKDTHLITGMKMLQVQVVHSVLTQQLMLIKHYMQSGIKIAEAEKHQLLPQNQVIHYQTIIKEH